MSRIDQALRRVGQPENTNSTEQSVFVDAWPIETVPGEDSAAVKEAVADSSGIAPSIISAPRSRIRFAAAWRERLAQEPDGDPALIEQFRRLAATLHHAKQANGIRSVMVSSAMPDDGKTFTAINLALVLANSYRYQVLLVDADLRRPSIPSVVDLADGAGLSEALRAATDQKVTLVPISPRLTVLPAGQAISNSIEALTSPRMRQILDEAITRFDWVILDAPPVRATADARIITQFVDGTLLVVRAGQTHFDDVQRAVDAIGREHILGVVLNGAENDSTPAYYGQAPGLQP